MNLDGTKLTTKKKVYSHWVIWISPFEQREPLDLFRKKKKELPTFWILWIFDICWPCVWLSCIGFCSPPLLRENCKQRCAFIGSSGFSNICGTLTS